jgi:uncharacterized repeat protein (TIGR02543 family)
MRWCRFPTGVLPLIGAGISLTFLHGCQDASKMTEADMTAAVVTKTVTVTGSGTGDGTVKSSPAGITCTVIQGQAAATGCKATFTRGVTVTLTATPKTGHSFKGWFQTCTGTAPCTIVVTTSRTVNARFLKGPFKITISGGVGTGSGTVRSQSGLTPVINCLISNGTAAATGCSAKYPANTGLVLTATPAAGQTFTWGAP